jgi:hypothetical protein
MNLASEEIVDNILKLNSDQFEPSQIFTAINMPHLSDLYYNIDNDFPEILSKESERTDANITNIAREFITTDIFIEYVKTLSDFLSSFHKNASLIITGIYRELALYNHISREAAIEVGEAYFNWIQDPKNKNLRTIYSDLLRRYNMMDLTDSIVSKIHNFTSKFRKYVNKMVTVRNKYLTLSSEECKILYRRINNKIIDEYFHDRINTTEDLIFIIQSI